MKVYIVTTEPFPNGMAATQRIKCYARAISESNIKCKILVVNRQENIANPLGNTTVSGDVNDYSYLYMGSSTGIPKGNFNKVLCRIKDTLKLIRYLLWNLDKNDCIIFYSYNILLLNVLKMIKRFKQIRLYLELCEHPSIQFVQFKSVDEEKTLKELRPLLNNIDGVFVISHLLQSLVDIASNHRIRTCLIPILYDKEETPTPNFERPSLGFRYIFHSGSLSQQKDGIVSVLEAIGAINDTLPKDVKYLLTGDLDTSRDKERIVACISKYNMTNRVSFLGYLNKDDLRWYQEHAYMSIVYKENNLQNRYCFATKIGEYLRAGTLLVVSDIGEQVYYLDNTTCVLYSNKTEELSRKVLNMFSEQEKRNKIAQNGKLKSKDLFFYSNYSKRIADFLQGQ